MNFLDKLKPVGLLVLRWGLGAIFIYNGYPMLFGNTKKFMDYFANLGFPPSAAYLVGAVQFFGGWLLVAGFMTRVVGLLLAVQMAVAIWKVHLGEGVLAVNEYSYPLALAVGAFALATTGAGTLSVDKLIFRDKA